MVRGSTSSTIPGGRVHRVRAPVKNCSRPCLGIDPGMTSTFPGSHWRSGGVCSLFTPRDSEQRGRVCRNLLEMPQRNENVTDNSYKIDEKRTVLTILPNIKLDGVIFSRISCSFKPVVDNNDLFHENSK
ncbi:hypothetical protein WA026_011553 [Henosepilachna vigintioctopunctata]|uniref:Uncharacterized protein n=1 Tax=Henosepilachna vigintioctopunctata TaxID=420089 RepID=A0AAW1TM47_9CUCU